MSNQLQQHSPTTQAQAMAANLQKVAEAKKVPRRVFRSNLLTMRYVFKAGKVANFLTKDGVTSQYVTDLSHEIEELDAEIAMGHPHILEGKEETTEAVDTMEALRQKHIQEYLAAQAKATKKDNDAGSSEQGKLNMSHSGNIAEAAAGSDSTVTNTPATGVKINVAKAS